MCRRFGGIEGQKGRAVERIPEYGETGSVFIPKTATPTCQPADDDAELRRPSSQTSWPHAEDQPLIFVTTEHWPGASRQVVSWLAQLSLGHRVGAPCHQCHPWQSLSRALRTMAEGVFVRPLNEDCGFAPVDAIDLPGQVISWQDANRLAEVEP